MVQAAATNTLVDGGSSGSTATAAAADEANAAGLRAALCGALAAAVRVGGGGASGGPAAVPIALKPRHRDARVEAAARMYRLGEAGMVSAAAAAAAAAVAAAVHRVRLQRLRTTSRAAAGAAAVGARACCSRLTALHIHAYWGIDIRRPDACAHLQIASEELRCMVRSCRVLNKSWCDAQRAFATQVRSLEHAAAAEDWRLLAGEVAALFADYGLAQELMMGSAHPLAALDMRSNLVHWEQALKLAAERGAGAANRGCGSSDATAAGAPSRLTIYPPPSSLLRLRGRSALHTGSSSSSFVTRATRRMFQQVLAGLDVGAATAAAAAGSTAVGAAEAVQLRATCAAGVARCTLRFGDVQSSVALAWAAAADDSGGGGGGGSYGVRLLRECAAILEDICQPAEAAVLGARCFASRAPLTCTRRCATAAAAAAPPPPQPERTFAVVRATVSAGGAETISRYCVAAGDWGNVIEFLLMVWTHGQMAAFVGVRARGGGGGGVGGGGGGASAGGALPPADALRVADACAWPGAVIRGLGAGGGTTRRSGSTTARSSCCCSAARRRSRRRCTWSGVRATICSRTPS
ncbi:hypothetical protein JKP88DRAFT_331557 [Tribonema minus]|uniref:Uncharacterized protein n=1 Tax=Tribonema minus TaxID=303371 RepID=A0A835YMW8_9STRA|nr:hypothetical protein JKP88DRAFT_331557 [Tribonema minus]